MKILHILQGYHPSIGGTEWLFQRVSEELVARYGDEVTVFTTNCYNAEGFHIRTVKKFPVGWSEIKGVRVRRFPVSTGISWFLWRPQQVAYMYGLPGNQHLRTWAHGPIVPGLERAIREFPAEINVASSFPLYHMFTSLKASVKSRRGLVFSGHIHPEDDWGFNRPMIYDAIRSADRYIALTQYEADYVASKGVDPQRVHVIGVGVYPEPYMGISSQDAKRRYGFGDDPVIGYIGQVAPQKLSMLIDAMPVVWQRYPKARLLIAGAKTTYHVDLMRIMTEWPDAYRARTKLVYNFPEEEKTWLFNACDVFVYPSVWESFGIAFIEAWAAGKPVIGCRRGAIPWVIDEGVDGLLVEYGKIESLAGAILLLMENPDWAGRLGQAGRAKVIRQYDWKVVASRFRDVYRLAAADQRQKRK